MARISLYHRSEFRLNVRAKKMSRSFLAHLSFNFYRSCQADYRHAQFRSSARLFMARVSPDHRSEFCPNVRAKKNVSLINRSIFIAPVRLIIVMLSIAHQRDFLRLESHRCLAESFRTGSCPTLTSTSFSLAIQIPAKLSSKIQNLQKTKWSCYMNALSADLNLRP